MVKVPLTKTYAHDVKAMLAAAPDAGVFYICNPNNPTGTLTPHSDIEYLVANKPKDSIVLVDEAYIHLSEAPSARRPGEGRQRRHRAAHFLESLRHGRHSLRIHPCPPRSGRRSSGARRIQLHASHRGSRRDRQPERSGLVPERRRINATIRQQTFRWLNRNGYSFIPSESNCFMLDTERPGKEVRDAMAKENVLIGRIWPIMPTYVRITVGTQAEMERFQTAFQKVMKA